MHKQYKAEPIQRDEEQEREVAEHNAWAVGYLAELETMIAPELEAAVLRHREELARWDAKSWDANIAAHGRRVDTEDRALARRERTALQMAEFRLARLTKRQSADFGSCPMDWPEEGDEGGYRGACEACNTEAAIGTEEVPHPVDSRLHTCGELAATTWRTADELEQIRSGSLQVLSAAGHATNEFTCDKCEAAPICSYAFDGYNTNGDCLAEK